MEGAEDAVGLVGGEGAGYEEVHERGGGLGQSLVSDDGLAGEDNRGRAAFSQIVVGEPGFLFTPNGELINLGPLLCGFPDLVVSKTAAPSGAEFYAGHPLTYTITIGSTGDGPAIFENGWSIFHDDLAENGSIDGVSIVAPAGVHMACAQGGGSPSLNCTSVGTSILGVGEEVRLAISYIPHKAGSLSNPRTPGACAVNQLSELVEVESSANNSCELTVQVLEREFEIVVHKTVDPVASRSGFKFTVSGCGISPQTGTTDASGTAVLANIPRAPRCSYTVTEAPSPGWLAVHSSKQVPGTPDDTVVHVNFRNFALPCQDCTQGTLPVPTIAPPPGQTPVTAPPSPTPTAPRPTPTVPVPTPTAGAQAPTGTPPNASIQLPASTSPTPKAPTTGNYAAGGPLVGVSAFPVVAGVVMLMAACGMLTLGHRRR